MTCFSPRLYCSEPTGWFIGAKYGTGGGRCRMRASQSITEIGDGICLPATGIAGSRQVRPVRCSGRYAPAVGLMAEPVTARRRLTVTGDTPSAHAALRPAVSRSPCGQTRPSGTHRVSTRCCLPVWAAAVLRCCVEFTGIYRTRVVFCMRFADRIFESKCRLKRELESSQALKVVDDALSLSC